ncbi:nucleotidyltransferase family protein [Thermogladius sp. 4427co]|uniref:nucleotidyltransferase family protein n=1 Tax=Thermogladius sp. 4427co TaxID=3450718 RepID=UPI003F7965E6
MAETSLTQKLIGVLDGWYTPSSLDEILKLAEVSKQNKLGLAYLRRVRDYLHREWLLEEARFRRYIRGCIEVAKALEGLSYAFYKFRKPLEHVSVDLDVMVNPNQISTAVSRLRERGFEVVVKEPYTVTMKKRDFIVDLYTYPSFAWVVYLDTYKLLDCCTEEFELYGYLVRGMTREAEAVLAAAHAFYKEYLYLLIDYYTVKQWVNSRALKLARELGVSSSLKLSIEINRLVDIGTIELPYLIHPSTILKLYLEKFSRDPLFRATSINILRYIATERSGSVIYWKLTRRSY